MCCVRLLVRIRQLRPGTSRSRELRYVYKQRAHLWFRPSRVALHRKKNKILDFIFFIYFLLMNQGRMCGSKSSKMKYLL